MKAINLAIIRVMFSNKYAILAIILTCLFNTSVKSHQVSECNIKGQFSGTMHIMEYSIFKDDCGKSGFIEIEDNNANIYVTNLLKKYGMREEICIRLEFFGNRKKNKHNQPIIVVNKLIIINRIDC